MTTLYKTDNEHLKKAFIEELKELGYNTYNSFDLSIVFTRDDHVGTCVTGSIISDQTPKTFDLKTQWNEALQHATEQLQPKFEAGDKVVYIDNNDGVCEVVRIKYNGKIVVKTNRYGICTELPETLRKATQEEIEQATRKTFFDWDVTKSKNTTKIGCQTFNNTFLKNLTEAIYNLDGDVTITELQDELREIGFESERDELPF